MARSSLLEDQLAEKIRRIILSWFLQVLLKNFQISITERSKHVELSETIKWCILREDLAVKYSNNRRIKAIG